MIYWQFENVGDKDSHSPITYIKVVFPSFSRHAISGSCLLHHRCLNDVAEHYRGVLDLPDQQMGVFLNSSSGVFLAFFFGLQTEKLVRILEFCS